MSELVITSKEDLEKMLRRIFGQIEKTKDPVVDHDKNDLLNQKQAAEYIGVTQSTLIRWKKSGRVPYEQLPGSTKVRFYKSQLKIALQRNSDLLQSPQK